MAELFRQYKQMFDNMVEGAFFQNADGTFFDANPAALEILGLSRDEFMGRTSYHPEWQVVNTLGEPLLPEQYPSMVALHTGRQVRNFVAGVFNPLLQGTVWLEITATPLLLEGETAPSQTFVTLHDITALKQTEKSLQSSDERFAKAFNLSPALMSISTIDEGCILEVNDRFCQVSQFNRQDINGRTSVELGWMQAEQRRQLIALLQRDGRISDIELELTRKDGATVYCLYSAELITIAGEQLLLATALDVTERFNSEKALKISEERYRAIVNTQTEFVDRYRPGGILTFVNEALCRYWGVKSADLFGKSFYPFIHEDDRQQLIATLDALTPEKPSVDVENRVNFPDGTVHWHSWTHYAIFGQNGTVIEYQSVGRDITGQKLAEQARNSYADKLSLALKAAMAGTWDRDLNTDKITWSSETFILYGLDPDQDEPSLAAWHRVLHPDDMARIRDSIKESIEQHADFNVDYRIILADGSIRWLKAIGQPSYDNEGRPLRISGITLDITERKKQGEALHNSERMARAILGSTNDLIVFFSPDGTVLLANDALAERLGLTVEAVIGTNIFSYFADDIRRVRQEKLAEVLRTANTLRYEDARAGRYYEHCLFPVINAENFIIGVTVFTRDITEQKQYEVSLKKAHDDLETRVTERTASLEKANEQIRQISFQLIKAEESERMRIAAELHDQVGQSLLLAKMKLDELALETATDGTNNRAIEISTMLENCIQEIRTLTFAMRPPLLDTAGFEAALEWLCKSIKESYRVQVVFSCCCRSIFLNSENRYSLYQAVRELLLNVVKHAGVCIAQLSLKSEGNNLMVQVSDNGNGFETTPGSCSSASGIGFGLFNVQQRIEIMDGNCRLDSQPGQGTVVTLTVPMERDV